jgi:hypothetical protein
MNKEDVSNIDRINFKDFISKILFLEQNLDFLKKHSNIGMLKINATKDVIEMQKVAKKIANHIDLDNLTFIINYNDSFEFSNNKGGQINLNEDRIVFIEISESLTGFPECVVATITHEITHKFLYLNRLAFIDTYENEIFTDLSAIYLGFGKLLLNGHKVDRIAKPQEIRDIPEQFHSNEKKHYYQEVGYLKSKQLTFIYITVNYMRTIEDNVIYEDLNPEILKIVRALKKEYSQFFSTLKLIRKLFLELKEILYSLAFLDKMTRYYGNIVLEEQTSWVKRQFSETNKWEENLVGERNYFMKEWENKRNRITKTLKLQLKTANKKNHAIKKINNKMIKYHNVQNQSELKSINEVIFNFSCPNCSQKLKSKKENIGIIVCPYCKFKFAADTRKIK